MCVLDLFDSLLLLCSYVPFRKAPFKVPRVKAPFSEKKCCGQASVPRPAIAYDFFGPISFKLAHPAIQLLQREMKRTAYGLGTAFGICPDIEKDDIAVIHPPAKLAGRILPDGAHLQAPAHIEHQEQEDHSVK
jgi:hypothetical protein